MRQYPWAGNVWELESCIERAVTLCEEVTIHPEHLGLSVKTMSADESIPLGSSLREVTQAAVRTVEMRVIGKVLRETGGNKTKAAEILQVSYKTLLTKIKDYGLDKE